MRSILMIAVLVLVPVLAWTGEDNLNQAEQLFRQMQYQKALTVVTHMLEVAGNDPKQLVESYSLQGLCFSALGRTEESVMAFRRLLAIDPDFQLSRDISPKLSPPFSKALAIEQKPILLKHNQPEMPYMHSGQGLEVVLQSDPLGMVRAVRLIFWGESNKENKLETTLMGPGKVMIKLPQETKADKVSYYFEAINKFSGVLFRLGSKERPFEIKVEIGQPSLALDHPVPDGKDTSTSALMSKEQPYATSDSDREKKAAERPFYKTWWFWTVVGVAVVGGVAAGVAIPLANKQGSSGAYNDYSITIK
jgi:tetratricopeptide (TPR) repeat protein